MAPSNTYIDLELDFPSMWFLEPAMPCLQWAMTIRKVLSILAISESLATCKLKRSCHLATTRGYNTDHPALLPRSPESSCPF